MNLSIKNKHQLDDRIKFQDIGHKYWIDGNDNDLISCTTFIKKFFKEFDFDSIIKNIIKSEKYNDPTYKYHNMSYEDIKKEWDKNSNESTDLGTKLHLSIEHFYNEIKVENKSIEYNYFLKFYEDHKHLEIYRTEWLIFSDILRISGSIDGVFINHDGSLSLCDWKRSKEIDYKGYNDKKALYPIEHLPDCNYSKYSLQLNLYRMILETFYDFKVKEMFLIVMHPNNDNYIKIEVSDYKKEIEWLFAERCNELKSLGYKNINLEYKNKIENDIQKNIKNCNMDLDDIINDYDESKPFVSLFSKRKNKVDTKVDTTSNKGKRWSKDEDNYLFTSAKKGIDIKILSENHKRSETAIKYRIMQKYNPVFDNISNFCKEYIQISENDLNKFLEYENKKKEKKEDDKKDNKKKKEIEKIPEQPKEEIKTKIELSKYGLSKKQQYAYDLISEGKNVFITSQAGGGKSYLIKMIYAKYLDSKYIAVTSTTGTSAILINGVTLHSYLGIGLGNSDAGSLYLMIQKRPNILRRWKDLDILIIDEISMLSPELFDKLEYLARVIRRNNKPFGGIQIILSGDFLQLPVVGETDSFCFDAVSWNSCIQHIVYLDENFRQEDSVFKNLLNEIRIGNISKNTVEILKSRVNVKLENAFGILPTKLYSLNRDVDSENDKELNNLVLKNEDLEFYQYDLEYEVLKNGIKNVEEKINKSCNAPFSLQLCVGAQVMLLYNMDLENKLVNGSRGVVIGFENDLPRVKFLNGITLLVDHKIWTLDENNIPIVQWTQIPLKVAFAVSIHKIQGVTIDYAEVDLSNIFENSQAYVALSRVRTLEGLSIKNFNTLCIKVNPRAVEFYKNLI
uniref:AAA+ ATPase domain-containing protein n=1 Tax=viral metagenome TaxID=1070528 RepID=A0A6C0DZX2_9ZZZZ